MEKLTMIGVEYKVVPRTVIRGAYTYPVLRRVFSRFFYHTLPVIERW